MNFPRTALVSILVITLITWGPANYVVAKPTDTPLTPSESNENTLKFSSKGKISVTSHFPGLVVWSNIKGDNASFLVRTEAPTLAIKAVLAESDKCEQADLNMCFEGTITRIKNSDAFKEGDIFLLGIDLVNKKQYFSFKSGFFENVDVSINLQKIWQAAKPVACTLEYNPVCGVDGKTYGNTCMLSAAQVELAYKGECTN